MTTRSRFQGELPDTDEPSEIAGPDLAERCGIPYPQLRALAMRGVLEAQALGSRGHGNSSRWLSTDVGPVRTYVHLRALGVRDEVCIRAARFLQTVDWRVWSSTNVLLVVGVTYGPVLAGRAALDAIRTAREPVVVVDLASPELRARPVRHHFEETA